MSTIEHAAKFSHLTPRERRRMVAGGAIGTGIEYYDYYLYGLGAAAIFPRVFFPEGSALAASLASFATFAVGFLLRPIGGFLFGHIGDRFGRKPALMITVIGMGLSTTGIGLIPSFQTIGNLAPILLIILRLLQGLFVGGEMGSAATLVAEHSPISRRGFYIGFLMSAGGIANILSGGLMTILEGAPANLFYSWGWRLPFLFSIVLVAIAVVLRSRLEDTPAFQRLVAEEQANHVRPLPIRELLRHPRNLVLCVLVGIPASIVSYIVMTFGLAYTVSKGTRAQVGFAGTMLVGVLQIILAPLWGRLSDRIGRKIVYIGGCAFLCLAIFPVFFLYSTGNHWLIWLGMILGFALPGVCIMTVEEIILPEMFPVEARTTGVNFGYQISAAIFGGFSPLIATALVAWAHGYWPIVVYVICLSVIGILATVFARLKSEMSNCLEESAAS